jgi:hypothetical protein
VLNNERTASDEAHEMKEYQSYSVTARRNEPKDGAEDFPTYGRWANTLLAVMGGWVLFRVANLFRRDRLFREPHRPRAYSSILYFRF